LKVEDLGLYSRGALLLPPEALRIPNDPTPTGDILESFFVFDAKGKLRTSGSIEGEDRLFFHAEASQAAYDPQRIYWLIWTAAVRGEKPAPMVQAATEVSMATVALRKYSLGADREFVHGGLRNENQSSFWVDRPFPQAATESLELSLPPWAIGPPSPVQGRIVVVFPSATDRNYVPAGALQSRFIELESDGKRITTEVKRDPKGFHFEIEFELPRDIRDSTLSLLYNPPGLRSERPLLDRFELESAQPLIWGGTDCLYELVSTASESAGLLIEQDPELVDSTTPPAYVFGKLREGGWVLLEREDGGQLEYRAPGPLVEAALLTGLEGNPVDALDSFTWPDWFDSPPRADQIVFSPKIFEDHLTHIGKLDDRNGYRCQWIDLEEVFDLFSGGQFSPFALKNFLSWTTCAWPDPQPASVLLVGDTSWDAWNRFPEGNQIPNWTPSYHTSETPDFPSDHWFVTGEPKDSVADWLWGRIPCQNTDHLEGYLAKRYDFEKIPRTEWSNRLLWVSDDNSPVEEHLVDLFRETFPQAMRIDHLRIRDFPFVDNFYYGPYLSRIQEEARNDSNPLDFGKISPACNLAILKALDEGVSVFVYYGHSGPNVLAHERALFGGGSVYSDIPSLNNEGKASLAFLMTCDVGRFDYARTPAKWSVGLSEELLFHRRGGCLALVASAGKGLPSDHKRLLGACLDGMFNRGLPTCGEILWSGKTQCLIPPGKNLSIEMFTLFGDPLFVPSVPRNRIVAEPAALRWNRDGSLQLKIRFLDGAAGLEADFWTLGDDFVELWRWDSVAVAPEGQAELTLPEARDLKSLLMACEFPSGTTKDAGSRVASLGLNLEEAGKPDWSAEVADGSPNLTVRPEDVLLGNYSVREGETLFIEAKVGNSGEGAAENVEVRAFDSATGGEVESFADYPPADIPLLLPGERKTVRIRWDRWGGTGDFEFKVKVDPEDKILESNEDDNEVVKTAHVYAKPDLAWGLVRASTSGAVDFSRAKSIPVDWVANPDEADLQQWSSFRTLLSEVDRGIQLFVPISNFGESESATCGLKYTYRFEGETPPIVLSNVKIRPISPSLDGKIAGRPAPVLILPGMKKIEIEIDPEGLVDESDTENNRLTFSPPLRLWDDFPSLVPRRKPPQALRGR
jgi:hypothetical protein